MNIEGTIDIEYTNVYNIIQQHCNVLLHHSTKINNSFIDCIAVSKKYDMPLITWIMDVYHRFLINYWMETNGKILLPIEFVDNYLFMQKLYQNSKLLYDAFRIVITTYHRTIGSFPEIGTSVFKYDDNMTEYIQIVNSINQQISAITKVRSFRIYCCLERPLFLLKKKQTKKQQ